MKKLPILTLIFVIFFCACTSDYSNVDNTEEVPVEVTFSGLDVSVVPDASLSPAAKTRVPVEETKVTRIAFKVYDSKGKEVYSEKKKRETDSLFNYVKFPLHVGDYTFVAVAHKGRTSTSEAADIESASKATIPIESVPSAVFSKTMSVTIKGNTTQNVAIDFGKRVTSTFNLVVKDAYPDEVKEIEITLNSSKTDAEIPFAFNPSTGLALVDVSYKDIFELKSTNSNSFTGKIPISSLFLTSAEQTADVEIIMKDESGEILYKRTLHDLTFRQHSTTIATGTFFSSDVTGSFNFDTKDDPSINVPLNP